MQYLHNCTCHSPGTDVLQEKNSIQHTQHAADFVDMSISGALNLLLVVDLERLSDWPSAMRNLGEERRPAGSLLGSRQWPRMGTLGFFWR